MKVPRPDADDDRSYPSKRVIDIALVALSTPLAIPVVTICAVIVKVTSPGPAIFWQERVGHLGQPFMMPKLRTMLHSADGNPVLPDRDRITRLGRYLRRLSLDELPQLLCVARGEMSVVGPRPALRYQVDRYDTRQRQRLLVRPGLTGLAQVRGRNGIPWSDRINYDLAYLLIQSPIIDLKLIAATFGVVLRGLGVEGHATDDPISSV